MQAEIVKEVSKILFSNLLRRGLLERRECGSSRLICRSTRDMLDMLIVDLRPKGTYVFQLQEVIRIFRNMQSLDLREFELLASSKGVQRLIRRMLSKLNELNSITFTSDLQVQQLIGFDNLYELGSDIKYTLQTCSYQGLLYLSDASQKYTFKQIQILELHVSFQHRQLQVLNAIFGQGWNMNDCLSVKQIIFHIFMLDQNFVGNMYNMRMLKRWFQSLEKIKFYSYGVNLKEIQKMVEELGLVNFEIVPFEKHFQMDDDKNNSGKKSTSNKSTNDNTDSFTMLSKA